MQVRPLSVGPILGATTATSARLWGRATVEMTPTGPRRCFGVIRVRSVRSARFRQPVFFKMNPNFDMTGIVLLTDLEADRGYVYQMGWFFSDLELDELAPDFPLDWTDISAIAFRPGVDDKRRPRSFVFGSCRYLLRLFGGSWFDTRGDKTFRSILEQIEAGVRTDLLLMIGDQIYADDMNFISPDQTLAQYTERYRDAFTQPNLRALMASTPTYMTLDDHEIEDGWPQHATERDLTVKYPVAIHAYQTYQASHSPLLPMVAENHMSGVPDHFWYTFSDGCCDFFVSDTRTERRLSSDPALRAIMSDEQLHALKSWLTDGSGRIKFVATSMPLFPDTLTGSSPDDKWGSFIRQRTEILDHVNEHSVPRVVFLGGDYHFSGAFQLVSPDNPDFRILSIISSPFFWPYPHGSGRLYKLSGRLTASSEQIYEVAQAGPTHSDDNFTRISANLSRLNVEVFGRKGERLSSTDFAF